MNTVKNTILKYRRLIIVIFHLCLVMLSYLFAFSLRFDFNMPKEYVFILFKALPILMITKLSIFYYFGIFEGLWRYVGMDDLWQIIKANCIATAVFFTAEALIFGLQGFPRSVFIVDFVMCTSLTSGVRFFTRLFRERYRPADLLKKKKVIIVGAGEAGILVLKEYRNHPDAGEVIGFIDDDPVKHNATIRGVKILGGEPGSKIL